MADSLAFMVHKMVSPGEPNHLTQHILTPNPSTIDAPTCFLPVRLWRVGIALHVSQRRDGLSIVLNGALSMVLMLL